MSPGVSAVFEEGSLDADAAVAAQLARELALELAPDAIEGALALLDQHTERAHEEG